MRSANRSPSPVRVGDVLLAALPALQERLLAERIRLGWGATGGADLSRRSRPRAAKAGPPPHRERPARRATPPTGSSRLDPDETALVESALAPVQDPDLATTVRRLMSKDLLGRPPRGG